MKTQERALNYWDSRLVSIRNGIRELIGSWEENDRADLSHDRKVLVQAAYQIIDIAVGTARSGNPNHVPIVMGLLRILPRVNAENPRLAEPEENSVANMDSFPSH